MTKGNTEKERLDNDNDSTFGNVGVGVGYCAQCGGFCFSFVCTVVVNCCSGCLSQLVNVRVLALLKVSDGYCGQQKEGCPEHISSWQCKV